MSTSVFDPSNPDLCADARMVACPLRENKELVASGWNRRLMHEERRLAEAAQLYRDLGYEVRVEDVVFAEDSCTECMRDAPHPYRVLYARRQAS